MFIRTLIFRRMTDEHFAEDSRSGLLGPQRPRFRTSGLSTNAHRPHARTQAQSRPTGDLGHLP